ncbi:MAG: hypothetical protein QOF84_1273 [Streptomyces sp.]|jgi:hypothetical protein|nr:hypothetical protein [Streptomyces sp.]MDX6346483.1 hypothetical protein [Streptomyces sp.]
MTYPLRRVSAAAAVLMTAAAVLLTGCSSDNSATTAAAGATGSATATEEPTQPVDPGKDTLPSGTKIPDDQLTPVTGTFTKTQRAYLKGRVPKGTDPAAILQLGQETCDRIAEVSKVNRDAVIGAIITGQITGAKGAVTHLCPQQASILAAAEAGFADGSYKVGTKAVAGSVIVPGTYRALTPTKNCNWAAVGKNGTAHKVTVTAGSKTFSSSGCFAWTRVNGGS